MSFFGFFNQPTYVIIDDDEFMLNHLPVLQEKIIKDRQSSSIDRFGFAVPKIIKDGILYAELTNGDNIILYKLVDFVKKLDEHVKEHFIVSVQYSKLSIHFVLGNK